MPPDAPPPSAAAPDRAPRPPAEPDVPWVESPFFEEILPGRGLSAEDEARARHLHEHGYLVLEDAFDPELLDRARRDVEPLLDPANADPRRSQHRFQDAWRDSAAVRAIATDPAVLGLLERLYGRRPVPFQTLSFSHGSEQRAHADTIHFSSIPARFMCGVWVAMEDVGPDNGTLYYYPGSHRLPDVDFQDLGLRYLNYSREDPLEAFTYQDYDRYEDFVERLMAAEGLAPVELTVAKGTALVWAAGLVHGGGPIRRPGATRWTQVTHVYFADSVYYAPIYSTRATGDLYLKRIVDLTTGEPVRHRWRGLELPDFPADGIYKLMLDIEAGEDGAPRDVLRLVSNRHVKTLLDENRHLREVENANLRRAKENLEAAIRGIERSLSFRLARALTAPARWAAAALRRR